MPIKVLIVDCAEAERGKLLAGIFYEQQAEVWCLTSSTVRLPDLDAEDEPADDFQFDLIVLHNNDRENEVWLEKNWPTRVTVRYTGGTAIPDTVGELYWIQRSIRADDPSPLAAQDAAAILGWSEAKIHGDSALTLPPILGGSKNERALQVLTALLPFGLSLEAEGSQAVSFEATVASRLDEHRAKKPAPWPPPTHARAVADLDQRVARHASEDGSREKWKADWSDEGGEAPAQEEPESGVILVTNPPSPPANLDEALRVLASSEAPQWNRRLTALRDCLLEP